MSKKVFVPKYIYSLYRLDVLRHTETRWLKPAVLYFNSSFVRHEIYWPQVLNKSRWYDSVETHVYEKAAAKSLEWTSIIHFRSKFTARIAQVFAYFMTGKVYRIQKMEVQ